MRRAGRHHWSARRRAAPAFTDPRSDAIPTPH